MPVGILAFARVWWMADADLIPAIAPASTAASTTVESLPLALDSAAEAGPSRQSAPAKRKYEVDVADREFCRKVSILLLISIASHAAAF